MFSFCLLSPRKFLSHTRLLGVLRQVAPPEWDCVAHTCIVCATQHQQQHTADAQCHSIQMAMPLRTWFLLGLSVTNQTQEIQSLKKIN